MRKLFTAAAALSFGLLLVGCTSAEPEVTPAPTSSGDSSSTVEVPEAPKTSEPTVKPTFKPVPLPEVTLPVQPPVEEPSREPDSEAPSEGPQDDAAALAEEEKVAARASIVKTLDTLGTEDRSLYGEGLRDALDRYAQTEPGGIEGFPPTDETLELMAFNWSDASYEFSEDGWSAEVSLVLSEGPPVTHLILPVSSLGDGSWMLTDIITEDADSSNRVSFIHRTIDVLPG